MSQIRYLGNFDVLSEGKFLWEILVQLRNFGVNRIVTKCEWLRRWPLQPSYLIVRKVAPKMDRWLWDGTLWADWIYRGRPLGVYSFQRELNRSDWRLIDKKNEKQFVHCESPFENITLPARMPLPPLLRHFKEKDASRQNRTLNSDDLYTQSIPYIDPDFRMLKSLIKQSKDLDPTPTGSVYDVDPEIFLDLYGQELPTKIDSWHCYTMQGKA